MGDDERMTRRSRDMARTLGLEARGAIFTGPRSSVPLYDSIELGLGVFSNSRTGTWLLSVRDLERQGGTGLPARTTTSPSTVFDPYAEEHAAKRLGAIRHLSKQYATQLSDTATPRELDGRMSSFAQPCSRPCHAATSREGMDVAASAMGGDCHDYRPQKEAER